MDGIARRKAVADLDGTLDGMNCNNLADEPSAVTHDLSVNALNEIETIVRETQRDDTTWKRRLSGPRGGVRGAIKKSDDLSGHISQYVVVMARAGVVMGGSHAAPSSGEQGGHHRRNSFKSQR